MAEMLTPEQQQYEDARKQREKDLAEGQARGQQIFAPGRLGRVSTSPSEDIQNVLEQRRQQAQGFSPEEMNAYRQQNLTNMNQENTGAERQLRAQLASQGIRGGAAEAALAKLRKDQANAGVNAEQNLFLQNIAQKRAGLNSLEQSAQANDLNMLQRQQLNQQAANKELYGQLSTEQAYGQMGLSERASINQRLAADTMANAQIQAAQLNAQAAREQAGSGGGGK